MKKTLSIAFLLLLSAKGYSQNFPGFNQYLVNPYLVNPASLLMDSEKSLDLFYRSQWSGFEDAPTTININGAIPLSSAFKLGAMITHDEVVLLSNTQAKITGVYKLPMGNSTLGIGLSGGANFSNVTVENPNDPVFNSTGNSFSFHADFGLTYQIKNFTVGASLPAIVKSNPFNTSESITSNFDDQIYYISYKTNLGQKFNLQVNGLYKMTREDFDFFEGTALLEFNKRFAVGGFYRQNNGPGIILRFRMTNINTAFGYSNEISSAQTGKTVGSTHEFNIGLRVPVKELPAPIEIVEEEEETVPPVVLAEEETVPADSAETIPPIQPQVDTTKRVTQVPVPVQEPVVEQVEEVAPDTVSQELSNKQYLLIIGTFNSASNAVNYLRKIKQMGYNAEMKFYDKLRYYYVYLSDYNTTTPNVDTVAELRKTTPFGDAWFKMDWEND